jgi:hypothetical protein
MQHRTLRPSKSSTSPLNWRNGIAGSLAVSAQNVEQYESLRRIPLLVHALGDDGICDRSVKEMVAAGLRAERVADFAFNKKTGLPPPFKDSEVAKLKHTGGSFGDHLKDTLDRVC